MQTVSVPETAGFSFAELSTAFLVFLGLCAAIVAVDKAVKAVRSWFAPKQTAEQALLARQAECDRHFKSDFKRLDALEKAVAEQKETDRVVLTALRAILSHEINGNSIDRMKSANEAIEEMLINRQ